MLHGLIIVMFLLAYVGGGLFLEKVVGFKSPAFFSFYGCLLGIILCTLIRLISSV